MHAGSMWEQLTLLMLVQVSAALPGSGGCDEVYALGLVRSEWHARKHPVSVRQSIALRDLCTC